VFAGVDDAPLREDGVVATEQIDDLGHFGCRGGRALHLIVAASPGVAQFTESPAEFLPKLRRNDHGDDRRHLRSPGWWRYERT